MLEIFAIGAAPAALRGTVGMFQRLGVGANGGTRIESLAANDVRFSQNTVSYNKVDRISGEKYTYDDLVQSMKTGGWKGDPVDVVKMPDGAFTSMDNTRISAARDAGINVQANVRGFNDPLPADMIANRRFGDATTWGEALTGRISNQKPPSFGNANPNGSPTPPKVTGKP
jgi:filamentous hemagglutinin